MTVELVLPNADAMGRVFLTWTPVPRKRGSSTRRATFLSASRSAMWDRRAFGSQRTRTHLGTPTLSLSLPASGAPVGFFVAGEFGKPSLELGDAVIEARGAGASVSSARRLSPFASARTRRHSPRRERDRFLAALGTLNGGGSGRFRDFRDMHVMAAINEAHGNVGFLPWHRAYLLDLERELQAIDPSVTLPYWRFDRPAPNVFKRRFMGVSELGRPLTVHGRPPT